VVTEAGGLSGGGEEGLAELGVPGLALGDAEPDAQVHVDQRIQMRRLAVEVEGLGVVAQGVAGGERSERAVGGPAGVGEGLGQPVGAGGSGPVAGQLPDTRPGPVHADRLQRFGDLAVGAGLAGAAQLGVHGVLDEGVHEALMTGRVGQLAHQRRPSGGVEDR
jgi:hypothetical protein